ncbi:MAG: hypothetical protein ACI91B_005052 [Planctomycetota bacterium]|jgi:hypothetical protein
MMLNKLLRSLSPLLLAATVASQVITVGPAGSGAMFEGIHEGIAAAPPGGTVLITPGSYGHAGGLYINKPLTVLGGGSTYTAHSAGAANPNPIPLTITNLPAGQHVTVVGLTLQGYSPTLPATGAAVRIANCTGTISLREVQAFSNLLTSASLVIRDAASVTLEGCWFAAGGGPTGRPMRGMQVERSFVSVTDSTIQGGTGSGTSSVVSDASGIMAIDSEVRVARSTVTGGDGTPFPTLPYILWFTILDGSPAIKAQNSFVHLRGGTGNALQGGDGGIEIGTSPHTLGSGASGVQVDATSLVSTTPDANIGAGIDYNGNETATAVGGTGPHAALAHALPSIVTVDTSTAPGNSATWELEGEPLAVCLTLFDVVPSVPFELPSIFGRFQIGFSPAVSLPVAVLDAGGAGTVSVALPPNPLLAGATAHVQTVSFAPSGWIAVSAPTLLAVR